MKPKNKSNELNIVRIYEASVKHVWDAWTDPKKAAMWWGPRGFTITTHGKDLRVGGFWKYTMHGPDGTDYPNLTKYFEVEEFKKLVYDHGGTEESPPMFRVTVFFSEERGKTKMDMTMTFSSHEVAVECGKFIKQASGNSTWDRLGEYLEEERGKDVFVINRTFDASIETMFQMWTNPIHISQWMPPTGMTMKFLRADIKPGGNSFYSMSGSGFTMYGRADYLIVDACHTMVYTQQFCDENENKSHHPGAPLWPELMLTTVKFSEEGSDQTRVTITWEPHGKFTPEEIVAFKRERTGMTGGWTGSFDKLEEYLAKNA